MPDRTKPSRARPNQTISCPATPNLNLWIKAKQARHTGASRKTNYSIFTQQQYLEHVPLKDERVVDGDFLDLRQLFRIEKQSGKRGEEGGANSEKRRPVPTRRVCRTGRGAFQDLSRCVICISQKFHNSCHFSPSTMSPAILSLPLPLKLYLYLLLHDGSIPTPSAPLPCTSRAAHGA